MSLQNMGLWTGLDSGLNFGLTCDLFFLQTKRKQANYCNLLVCGLDSAYQILPSMQGVIMTSRIENAPRN